MKSRRQLRYVLGALLVSFLAAVSLLAQDQASDANPNGDPPARVARIQYISGEVSMQPGGVNDWVAASLNRPLTTSDRVWADKDSRVELNVATGFIRMGSESSLTLTNVSNNTVQMQLDQGTLELTVRHLEPGEVYEVDTPNLAFTVMKPGVFRIDVPPSSDQTLVTVRKGYGEATGRGPAVKVGSGQQVRFSGQNSLQHVADSAPAPDGFDDWAQVRDKRLDGSVSARYVAPGVIGYQDLDYYGTWQDVPTYGNIWVPTGMPVGWAPYRYGSWAYVGPWGWTWVDDAPWGFAPFHYGRWVSYGGNWGWAPGPMYAGWNPYYAPALVGWVGGAGWGFGASFGIGFGVGGGCGWFPLGWGEPYYPGYRGYGGGYVSRNYIRNVNVTNTNISNINNVTNNYYKNTINNTHFANRNVPGAVTAAPKSALANGQNIARVGMAVPRSELGKGQVLRNVDVTPGREAMLGGHAPRTTGIPPRTAVDRPVVTRSTTPGRPSSQPLANQPTEARSIPPSPLNSGAHNPSGNAVNQPHNVPRPPQQNASPSATATSPYQGQPGSQHVVPRPPYAGGPSPSTSTAAERNNAYGNTAGHSSSPSQGATHPQPAASPGNYGSQPGKGSQGSKPNQTPNSNPGMASANVPHPPAGYTYHPAPAYTASNNAGRGSYGSNYSGNSGGSYGGNYGGNSRSYTPNTTPYVPSRSTYGSSAPAQSYHAYGGYGSAPSYSAHVSPSAAPHYSAPSYSGGGGHYSGGGGGGGGHYSGGGGGGGGHSNSSGAHSAGHSR